MGKETLLDKIKNVIYKIVSPVYLWSINEESIESYTKSILFVEFLSSDGTYARDFLKEKIASLPKEYQHEIKRRLKNLFIEISS